MGRSVPSSYDAPAVSPGGHLRADVERAAQVPARVDRGEAGQDIGAGVASRRVDGWHGGAQVEGAEGRRGGTVVATVQRVGCWSAMDAASFRADDEADTVMSGVREVAGSDPTADRESAGNALGGLSCGSNRIRYSLKGVVDKKTQRTYDEGAKGMYPHRVEGFGQRLSGTAPLHLCIPIV